MPKIFLYEACTAQGLGKSNSDPLHHFYSEGFAMIEALRVDFESIPGFEVYTLAHDVSSRSRADYRREIQNAAKLADASLLIAPEIDGELEDYAKALEEIGAYSLGSQASSIAVAADKWRTAEHWQRAGVRTPRTWLLSEAEFKPGIEYLLKPRQGAGSWGIQTVTSANQWELISAQNKPTDWLIQERVAGLAASMAFLVGPSSTLPLIACEQFLGGTSGFSYQGGRLPLQGSLGTRAERLARRALAALPAMRGYVGFDLCLGSARDGSEDYMIECNARLTTSYLGLRAKAKMNLAAVWWSIVHDDPGQALRVEHGTIEYARVGSQWQIRKLL